LEKSVLVRGHCWCLIDERMRREVERWSEQTQIREEVPTGHFRNEPG